MNKSFLDIYSDSRIRCFFIRTILWRSLTVARFFLTPKTKSQRDACASGVENRRTRVKRVWVIAGVKGAKSVP